MLETLASAPVLVKIFASLFAVILINRATGSQIAGIAGGTAIISLWSGHSAAGIAGIALERLLSTDNLFLLLVVYLIIILSSQMKKTGCMDGLVNAISSRVSSRNAMAILPAVIGLLPMPGGAVFSAPLVDSCDPDKSVPALDKTRINYWFRHVWEYWWPLYPGVLLAVDISGLQVWQFMLIMLPVTGVSILSAWFFLLRKIKPAESINHGKSGPFSELLNPVLPIIIIMAVYAVTSIAFPLLLEVSRYLPITIGIITAVAVLQKRNPLTGRTWKSLVFDRKAFSMVLLVALIRIYGAFIEGRLPDGSLMMDVMRTELASAGISGFILIMLIPLLCGISTGIAVGTVGAAFPIVMNLTGADPGFAVLASTTLLAYTFGHAGQLLSPVHVCLIVTNQYFGTSLAKSIAGMLKPVITVLAAGLLLSRLLLVILH